MVPKRRINLRAVEFINGVKLLVLRYIARVVVPGFEALPVVAVFEELLLIRLKMLVVSGLPVAIALIISESLSIICGCWELDGLTIPGILIWLRLVAIEFPLRMRFTI